MSEQASLNVMCEVFLAEIDNGRRGGFPVETLPVPHVIREKMKSMKLLEPTDDLPFDAIVSIVAQMQKARRAKKNPVFMVRNTPKKAVAKSPVREVKTQMAKENESPKGKMNAKDASFEWQLRMFELPDPATTRTKTDQQVREDAEAAAILATFTLPYSR